MEVTDSVKGAGPGSGASADPLSGIPSEATGSSGGDAGVSAPPAARGNRWADVYAAEAFGEGMRAIFRVVPYWVPVVGLASGISVYFVVFRVRLFLSQWRIAERQRAERKYDLLENLRGVSVGPVGAVQPLADDVDDEDEEEEDDETAVSMYDVDEFRSSLGIRLPRDEDLLAMVEKMLMADPIPDGWVLYRTTAGIIRFMNLNTQELFFFHPGKRKERVYIEEELKKRNRQAMETRYSFSYEDEGMNSMTVAARSSHVRAQGHPGPSPIDFGDDGIGSDEDESQNSTFKRLFGFFLEKEQKRIEQDVARARSSTANRAATGSGAGAGSAGSTGPRTPRGAASPNTATPSHRAGSVASGGGTGMGAVADGRRQGATSSTYRVVSSSAIQASRGAGGASI